MRKVNLAFLHLRCRRSDPDIAKRRVIRKTPTRRKMAKIRRRLFPPGITRKRIPPAERQQIQSPARPSRVSHHVNIRPGFTVGVGRNIANAPWPHAATPRTSNGTPRTNSGPGLLVHSAARSGSNRAEGDPNSDPRGSSLRFTSSCHPIQSPSLSMCVLRTSLLHCLGGDDGLREARPPAVAPLLAAALQELMVQSCSSWCKAIAHGAKL